MKDIVIPYAKNYSGELDTCIALIKKNVPHRNIYVVESHDRYPHYSQPHINQILKIKWAIDNLDVSDDFYLFNDDFFVLEPIEETPYYHRGTLGDHIVARKRRDRYYASLVTTADYIGKDALSYELHLPFLLNKSRLSTLIESIKPEIRSGKCPLIRSLYGNAYNVGGEYIDDVKNVQGYEGMTYLSTDEGSFRRDIGNYIRSKV